MLAAGNEKKMKKLTINRWAAEDRPREKMMLKGAEALSDAELLAILIGSGNTEESAVALMQRTLACCNNDLNWANAETGKSVRNGSRYTRPMTSTESFIRSYATSP